MTDFKIWVCDGPAGKPSRLVNWDEAVERLREWMFDVLDEEHVGEDVPCRALLHALRITDDH